MSVKFVSAILGPEMGAPILWTPGKMRPFCRKNHVHKIPRFRGGGILGFGGGGGGCADFICMGARIFLILVSNPIERSTKQGNARGTSEVRRGTSSNHFHCPVPRSSSHIGPRFKKGRKGAGVKGAGVANCRIFRSAVPSVVVWSILLVSLSGVKKKL